MKKHPLLCTFLTISALILLTACGQQPSSNSRPPSSSSLSYSTTVKMEVSWATAFQDIKSGKKGSDAIAYGTITTIQHIDSTTPTTGLIFTDYTFKIDQVVWDPHNYLTSNSILIHQTGGIVNNTKYEVDDDPLFTIGEKAILFLHFYQFGHAFVAGGPTGRFLVQNGTVQPRITTNGEYMTASFTGTPIPLDQFITQIKNA